MYGWFFWLAQKNYHTLQVDTIQMQCGSLPVKWFNPVAIDTFALSLIVNYFIFYFYFIIIFIIFSLVCLDLVLSVAWSYGVDLVVSYRSDMSQGIG